jgi:hypothetical protein
MRFVFDVQHPVDVNFFRSAIRRLRADGHQVLLVVLRRGSVRQIVRHEYPDVETIDVGRHVSFRPGLILRTGLWRARARQGAAGCQSPLRWASRLPDRDRGKLLGFKSVGAYDDPEHRPNFLLSSWLDRFVLPECLGETGSQSCSSGPSKEWAYVAPGAFTPTLPSSTRIRSRRGVRLHP